MPSILRGLKILEVSSVDRGAGEGVRIVLMKRDDAKTDTVDDLKKAIAARTAEDLAIIARAKALGAEDLIPDTWKLAQVSPGEIDLAAIQLSKAKEPDDMTMDELNKIIADQVSKAVNGAMTAIPEIVTKAVGGAVDAAVAKAFPPPKKDPKKDGEDDDCGDEAKKALAIAALPPEVRKVFDEAEANAKKVAKFMAEQELADFSKRAVGMGLKKEDGVLLQKAYTGDAAAQKAFEERLATVTKAATAQKDTAVIFSEFGSGQQNGTEGASAYDQLMAKGAELRAKDPNLSEAQAYAKVATDPANKALVQQESRERLAKVQRTQVN